MPLKGRPLIQWTIEAAKRSSYLDTVCVSTDDRGVISTAKDSGAEAPFVRPAELATDAATTFSVVKHCIEYYLTERDSAFDYIVLLQPTSPLRIVSDIDSSIEQLVNKKADAIISVCEMEHSPLWCNTLPEDLSMEGFLTESVMGKRSQDLPKYYRINGALYIAKTDKLLSEGSFFLKNNIYAYVMPAERSVDIDTKTDFMLAEALLS